MNILIYGLNYAPEIVGVAKYTTEMAEWLAERGHRVSVVSSHPYYPAWKVFPGYRPWAYKRERLNGVDIVRCPIYVPRKQTGLRRVVHLASFVLSCAPVLFRETLRGHDICIVIAPTIGVVPAAIITSRLLHVPLWLHIQDFEIEMAYHLGLLTQRRMKRIMDHIEAMLYRHCDRVSTISDGMDGVCAGKGVAPEKRAVFPNWVDPGIIHPVERTTDMIARFNMPENAFIVLFSGTIACKHDIDVLFAAAKECAADPDIRFVICGEGTGKARIAPGIAGLPNVTLLPLQPAERLNDLLNIADVHVLPMMSEVRDYVMPSRLTGMCASGRPVLCLVDNGSYLADAFDAGITVLQPGDSSALSAEIMYLKNNPDEAHERGWKNRDLALSRFNKKDILIRFESMINDLTLDSERKRG